jgi:hypothetical protein
MSSKAQGGSSLDTGSDVACVVVGGVGPEVVVAP